MSYMIMVDGEWFEGYPSVHGQIYRIYFTSDFWVETYWQDPNLEG